MSTSFSAFQPPQLQYMAKFYLFPTPLKKCSKFFWSTFFVRLPKPEFWSPSLLTSLVIGSLQPEISFDQSRERQFLKWLKFFHPSFYISRFLSLALSRSPLSLTKKLFNLSEDSFDGPKVFLPIWQICLPDPEAFQGFSLKELFLPLLLFPWDRSAIFISQLIILLLPNFGFKCQWQSKLLKDSTAKLLALLIST